MTVHAVTIFQRLANLDLVAEPIALELRQKNGNIYLHAQIFAGFMYIAAGLCMWLLRGWKIQQIEQITAEKEKRPEDIDTAFAESIDDRAVSPAGKRSKSSILKSFFMWEKV